MHAGVGILLHPNVTRSSNLPTLPYLITPKGMSGVVHANPSAFSLRIAYLIIGCLTVGFNLMENRPLPR